MLNFQTLSISLWVLIHLPIKVIYHLQHLTQIKREYLPRVMKDLNRINQDINQQQCLNWILISMQLRPIHSHPWGENKLIIIWLIQHQIKKWRILMGREDNQNQDNNNNSIHLWRGKEVNLKRLNQFKHYHLILKE